MQSGEKSHVARPYLRVEFPNDPIDINNDLYLMISSIVKGNINQETLLMDPTLSQKVASDFCLQLGSWLNINFYMTHMVRGLFLMLRNPILFLVLSICFRRLISREVGQLPSSIGDYSLVTLVVTLLVANSSIYWKNHQPYSGSDFT